MTLVSRLKELFAAKPPEPAKFVIVESTSGTWRYHLKRPAERLSVCGRLNMMSTSLPLSSWGIVTHLNERYCARCQQLSKEP